MAHGRHGGSKASDTYTSSKKPITKGGLRKLFRLFRFMRPQAHWFAVGMVLLVLSSGASLVFPWLTGELVNTAQSPDTSNIHRLALMLLGVFLANAIMSYFRIYIFAIVTERTLALLRQTTYDHLIRMPMQFFATRRVGELNSRLSADISQLQDTFTSTFAQFLRQVIIIFGGVALLAYISVKLTLVMLAMVPVVMVTGRFFGNFIRKLSKETQNKVAESNTIVEETLQGIINVKSFANEWYENNRYRNSTNSIIGVALRGAKWRGAFAAFNIFCLFGSIVAVIWYGVYLVHKGDEGVLIGDLFKFVLYSVFIGGSIAGIAELYSELQKSLGATENLMEILEEQPEPVLSVALSNYERIHGNVVFDNVNFSYPTRADLQVLNGISMSVQKGQTVAFVGPSGAGKSTLSSLLLRFYQPTNGAILVDGKNANDYHLTEYRHQLAVVPQEVLLFGGSIRENIAYGKPNASDEEILEAARKANAWEFIQTFPEGLNTVVGERGVQLSGGQRQRIAIARAILKNPAILILDEATSSLDSESERLVQAALDELMKGRTSFVIAHRLSTIRRADCIFVIEKGGIREQGTHDQLMQIPDGLYRNLYTLQTVNELTAKPLQQNSI